MRPFVQRLKVCEAALAGLTIRRDLPVAAAAAAWTMRFDLSGCITATGKRTHPCLKGCRMLGGATRPQPLNRTNYDDI